MKIDIKLRVESNNVHIYSFHNIADIDDDNIDIFVETNGKTYSGQVYTYKNLKHLMKKPDLPNYFFDRHGVIVESLSDKCLKNTVTAMIKLNELDSIFCLCIEQKRK